MDINGKHYDIVVVGSGFGASMVALSLARLLQEKGQQKTILMLERGTWWTTPVSTVADKEVRTYDFLRNTKQQPVQFWPSMDHFKGVIDILLRCVRHEGNEDGLYDFTTFGNRGFLGINAESDGVAILRASGVGGGSLVYSNITIQPPDVVFKDARWPGWTQDKATRDRYFDLAREAIGFGVVYAREAQAKGANADAKLKVYGGLHNIATRTARLDPQFTAQVDPSTGRTVNRLTPAPATDPNNALWLDRARVFQTAVAKLTNSYGNVESSINDLPVASYTGPAANPTYDPGAKPANYCERQGRCNVGCLPGARYTLNKQLMKAVLGMPGMSGAADTPPQFSNLALAPLVEVQSIESVAGRYAIKFRQRKADDPEQYEEGTLTAERVVLSAGCVGTTEILLRSQKGLAGLSDRLGEGFSTNGDYLAFLEDIDQQVTLTKGPVTTSFAHFNADGTAGGKFHTLEDQGIPKAFASLTGQGVPFIHALANGGPRSGHMLDLLRLLEHQVVAEVGALFTDSHERQPQFASEDEQTAKMMCVVGMGLDAADGKFTLGQGSETALRLRRPEGKAFHKDPIYDEIRSSLARLAGVLRKDGKGTFMNPFLTPTADALAGKSVVLTHPLGGCRMAADVDHGVVDQHGRVFDKSKANGGIYPGLYVADASMVPTALGLNPSLTISALALHVADAIAADMKLTASAP